MNKRQIATGLIFALAVAGAGLYLSSIATQQDQISRLKDLQAQAVEQRAEILKLESQNYALTRTIYDLVNPRSCLARQIAYLDQLRAIQVINDNRLISGVRPLPLPKRPPCKLKIPRLPKPTPPSSTTSTTTSGGTRTVVVPGPAVTVTKTARPRPSPTPTPSKKKH